MRQRSSLGNRWGMSLIELIVTVVLVVLIVLITLVSAIQYIQISRISRAKNDVAMIRQGILELVKDTGYGPGNLQMLPGGCASGGPYVGKTILYDAPTLTTTATGGLIVSTGSPAWKGPYLRTAFKNDPWGRPYYLDYCYTQNAADTTDYGVVVVSWGPDGTPGNSDDIFAQITPISPPVGSTTGPPGTTTSPCAGVTCPAGGVCENPGYCSGGACVKSYKPPGITCDDGNQCTYNDHCDGSGSCTGTSYSCSPPPLPQQITTCIPSYSCDGNGGCNPNKAPDGTPCGTSTSACVLPSTCQNGVCVTNYAPAGTPCNDGNACTYGDQCDGSGNCGGTHYSCPLPGQKTSTCTPNYNCDGSGGCTPQYAPAGTTCDDGNKCTCNETCNGAGTCSGTPPTCPANSTENCDGKTCACVCNCGYSACTVGGAPACCANGCRTSQTWVSADGTVAACTGNWPGNLSQSTGYVDSNICAPCWHLCSGNEPSGEKWQFGSFGGCYAWNAGVDYSWTCSGSIDELAYSGSSPMYCDKKCTNWQCDAWACDNYVCTDSVCTDWQCADWGCNDWQCNDYQCAWGDWQCGSYACGGDWYCSGDWLCLWYDWWGDCLFWYCTAWDCGNWYCDSWYCGSYYYCDSWYCAAPVCNSTYCANWQCDAYTCTDYVCTDKICTNYKKTPQYIHHTAAAGSSCNWDSYAAGCSGGYMLPPLYGYHPCGWDSSIGANWWGASGVLCCKG